MSCLPANDVAADEFLSSILIFLKLTVPDLAESSKPEAPGLDRLNRLALDSGGVHCRLEFLGRARFARKLPR